MSNRYLLDSNIIIALLKGEPTRLLNKLAALAPQRLCLSPFVLGELLTGAEKSRSPEHYREVILTATEGMELLPYLADDAAIYARIRAQLEKSGQPIGPVDTLIAAQALRHKLVMVTANMAEFQRVPGLKCENWLK